MVRIPLKLLLVVEKGEVKSYVEVLEHLILVPLTTVVRTYKRSIKNLVLGSTRNQLDINVTC